MTNILVLEDDNEINQLLCNILSENQYHCVSEYSGKHAYETRCRLLSSLPKMK